MKFLTGQLVATPGVMESFDPLFLRACFRRHVAGDWGVLPPEDRERNERALLRGARLLSAYIHDSGAWLWIITEADRSATTFLLPEEHRHYLALKEGGVLLSECRQRRKLL